MSSTVPNPAKPGKPWRTLGPLMLAVVAFGVVGIAVAAVVKGGDKKVSTTLPAGTTIVVSLQGTITTEKAEAGDGVTLRSAAPMTVAGATLPGGVTVRGEVTHAVGGGRVAGAPELTIRFHQLEVGGTEYEITAEPFRLKGKDDAVESAAEIGGGTVAGAVVGAVAGDAVKGAIVGAVLGTGVAVVTKGNQIVLPSGQKIRVRLAQPVTVEYRPVGQPKQDEPDK